MQDFFKKATWTCGIQTVSNYMHKVLFPKAAFEKFPVILRLLLNPVIPFKLLLLALGKKFSTM